MKRLSLLLFALAATMAVAQAPTPGAVAQHQSNLVEHEFMPTYSDLNCAGFISKDTYNSSNYLVGGLESPAASQFGERDTVFLTGGGYEQGKRYSIIRPVHDPNRYPAFPGQPAAISATGIPYDELGHVQVTAIRGDTAIAKVEFSCAPMRAGDLVVPYVEKEPVHFRPATTFDRFPAQAGSVIGRILMAKDFDVIVGTGHKVYLNVGSSKGVKIGDYFRAVRGYDPTRMDEVDALAYKARETDDTQYKQKQVPNKQLAKLPVRALGEMVVISVTPNSATAMITNIVEGIAVGDVVELEGGGAQQ